MKNKLKVLALVALTSFSAVAEDYDLEGRFGIGGGAGWAIPILGNDFDDAADEDFMYQFHGRYHFSAANSLELNFSRYDFEGTDIGAKTYDLLYSVRLAPKNRFSTILGLGVGAADLSNYNTDNDLKLSMKARAGFQYALSQDIYASAFVDYVYINKMVGDQDDLTIGEIHALAPQLALTFYFGSAKEKKSAPAAAPVAAAATGLMDTDGDGVIDAKDKCPGTAAGQEVNGYGCMMTEKANIRVEVLFATGRSDITESNKAAVEELASFLKEHPETKAEIQGHTDNVGSDETNRKLSQARADAMKAYLIEKLEILPSRVSSYGYGETKPIASNSTSAGRSENRRVVAVISQGGEATTGAGTTEE